VNISFILYLFLVSEFGIVVSTLLSFLATGVTMLFGYLILKKKPSKKDIYLTIITTVLVGIGFYFK
jgi:drug/metabolite transporter (DMT)-like permease